MEDDPNKKDAGARAPGTTKNVSAKTAFRETGKEESKVQMAKVQRETSAPSHVLFGVFTTAMRGARHLQFCTNLDHQTSSMPLLEFGILDCAVVMIARENWPFIYIPKSRFCARAGVPAPRFALKSQHKIFRIRTFCPTHFVRPETSLG